MLGCAFERQARVNSGCPTADRYDELAYVLLFNTLLERI